MRLPRTTKKGQGALAVGSIISALLPLVILLVIYFIAKGWLIDALESFLPQGMANTAAKLLFGFLGFYFLLKVFTRR